MKYHTEPRKEPAFAELGYRSHVPGTTTESISSPRRAAFGRRLRELRETKGMTQTSLAAAAGLNRSFYVRVEHGQHSISVDRLYAIATALDVDIRQLFPDIADNQASPARMATTPAPQTRPRAS